MNAYFSIKASLQQGWAATKANFLVLLGLLLGYLLINSLLSWIPMGMPPLSVTFIVVNLILCVFSLLFSVGYLKVCLQAADGEEPSFAAFGEMASRAIPYFLNTLIVAIGYVIGLFLLVIPGFYFILRVQYAPYFIVEGYGPVASIKKSWELTDGHVLRLLGLMLLYIGIILLGLVVLLIGVFVSIVWIQEIYACSYRLLQKELAEKRGIYTESTLTATEG